ncbi:MAG: phosphatase PAP2 family protein [Cellulosilyticaceae bacterium]
MNWEIQILQFLQEIRNPFLTSIMEAITFMAESLFIVVIIALLYWCVDKQRSLKIAWIVLFSSVINGIVKNIVKMPRPFQRGIVTPIRVETATSYSFPSGHTQIATSFWGGAMTIFRDRSVVILGSVFIILTAITRLYLGVHWPIDVIGGIVLGVICISIADKTLDIKKGFTKVHIVVVGIAAIGILILPVDGDLAKVIGALLGMVVGAYLERRYINFKEKQPWKKQLIKIAIGIGGTLILYAGLKILLPSAKISYMIRYMVVLLWIVAGAPLMFNRMLEKKGK